MKLLQAAGDRRAGEGMMLRVVSDLLKAALKLGLLGLAAASLAPLFFEIDPLLSVAEHFALQIAVAAAVFAVLALSFRLRIWAAAGGLVAFGNLILLWPFLAGSGGAAAATELPSGFQGLKVVSFNVWYRSDGYDAALDYLRRSDADMIGLVEVSPDWKAALQPLDAIYPYRADCVGQVANCEVMLLEISFSGG